MEADEREIVLDILVEHELHGTYSNQLIRRAQDRYASLPLTQRSFIKRLAEGTIEREMELDGVIRRHQKNPGLEIKPVIRCLLRMSIYQIYYMDSVPDFAACNEAVRICRKRHYESQAGFVNGVLRAVCREKAKKNESGRAGKAVTKTNDSKDHSGTPVRSESAWISEKYSMPSEIVDLWVNQLGKERTESLCKTMLEVRPVCIRLNALLSEAEKREALDALTEAGVELTPGRWAPDCYYLKHATSLAALPGFREGRWMVQDESSQLAAQAAGLPSSSALQIYDLCAAPGGKTILSAELAPEGHIDSFDLTKKKTDLIRSNLGRMHIHNVTVGENDASNFNPSLEGKADIVLCDVPCSGLGVMTKKRDIKYNFSMKKVHSLTQLQKKIVSNAVRVVKTGGILIYSTCTINRLENEKMAEYIEKLYRSTGIRMVPEDLKPFLPEGFPGIEGNRVQMFPDVHGTDGFFIARFRREA